MTISDSSGQEELDRIMLKHMQYTGWNGHLEAEVYQLAKQEIIQWVAHHTKEARLKAHKHDLAIAQELDSAAGIATAISVNRKE